MQLDLPLNELEDSPVQPDESDRPDCYVGGLPVKIPTIVAQDTAVAERIKGHIDEVFAETRDPRVFGQCCKAWWAVLDEDEALYAEATKGWSHEALYAASKGFAELQQHFVYDGGLCDVLGQVYMMVRSTWGGKFLGQYFTPWPVCLIMAQVTGSDMDPERLQNGPPITVLDPACGSGSMLLALRAHVVTRFGRRALRNLKCYGQDIDETCVVMSKIQLRMSNVPYMLNWLVVRHAKVTQEWAQRKQENP